MLRGRCSSVISERPTPSPAPKNPLTPFFPLHPGNSPVTPLFPLHTQKQGGGGALLNVQLLTGHPTKDAHPERAARAEGSLSSRSPNPNHPRTYRSPSCKSNHSRTCAKQGVGGIPFNASTDNSLVYITLCLLATKIQNVGAPTFSSSRCSELPYTETKGLTPQRSELQGGMDRDRRAGYMASTFKGAMMTGRGEHV